MPMDFPDFDSLKMAALCWKFRRPKEGEAEQDYRKALADFVEPKDPIESMEIRKGVGWDQFDDNTELETLLRALLTTPTPSRSL